MAVRESHAAEGESLRFALAAAELASNTRCEDVVLLDLRGRSPVTEFFLIATGTSPRQMRTVIDELQDLGSRMGFKPWRMDGYESARWIVLDCINVVAHVFDADGRDFYDLELLWGDSPRIGWRKELGLPPAADEPPRLRRRFEQAAGEDERDAEEEDARLEGHETDKEEGDADVDEDAELDEPVVMELPDLSTGSNSVEFVEIDPPAKRRQRGRVVYPTPIEEPEDTTAEERSMGALRGLAGAAESLDEDEQQRRAEADADKDVEAVSREDLRAEKPSERTPKKALRTRKDNRGAKHPAPGKANEKKAKAGVAKRKSAPRKASSAKKAAPKKKTAPKKSSRRQK